jgi:multidrug efflux pump subunit AcrA (membrane-fusion protein)
LHYPGPKEQPLQIEQALGAYIDESHVQWLRALPLHRATADDSSTSEVIGILILERFAHDPIEAPPLADAFTRHAALALDNALLAHRWLWFRWVSSWLDETKVRTQGRAWRRWAMAAVAALLVVIALWPMEFRIAATGRLMPKERQDIFAPVGGVVADVHVHEGDAVTSQTKLVTLRSPALELLISEVTGKRQAAEASLASARALRLQANATEADRARSAAQEEELKATLAGLAEQSRILAEQQTRLVARSPQPGQISTRDVERRLSGRPVNPGDLLLSVANLQGAWQLEIDLPEYRLQQVLRAQSNSAHPLHVHYLLASAPRATYTARLESISDAAQLSADQQPIVPLVANIDDAPPDDARPHATVYAQIDCGRRPLGFVWLHDVWEAIKIRWWQ